MNNKNKSINKLSPIKSSKNKSINKQDPLLKGKWDQLPSATKSNQSTKSLHSRPSLSKSATKSKSPNPIKQSTISRQYTKSTFQRYQQKLSIHQKITQLIAQINSRQSRLKSYFDIYRLLESQVGQQRCLQHNNDLSLYCQTECKVLCVHCVYGQSSRHKTHKVVPLKDSVKDVVNDIGHLQNTIRRDIDTIKMKIKTSQMNEKFVQRHYRQQIQQLQKIYVQKLRQIQVDFCQRKKYVNEYFNAIKQRNIELTNSLKQFEQNVSIKLSILNKDQPSSRHDTRLVSKQTILTKISQLSNLSGMALEDMDQKDIGQNCLRNRVNKVSKK